MFSTKKKMKNIFMRRIIEHKENILLISENTLKQKRVLILTKKHNTLSK